MNAGAWGAELKDVLLSVTLMKEDGEVVEKPRQRLKFSYRRLALPPSWVILKGRFQLKKGEKEEIFERVKSYSEMRKRTQPLDYPSAGSIFKNPKEGPAGRWIEELGLKGFRMGQCDDFRPACQFHHQPWKGHGRRGDRSHGVGGEEDL